MIAQTRNLMSMSPSIIAKDVVIRFPVYDRISQTVRSRLVKGNNSAPIFRSVTALDGVNLSVQAGDRIGLLGKNGSGKSTILRTIAGVFPPTSGELQVTGDTASLFEIGVGSDNDACGYENIPLLMAANGIPRERKDELTRDVEEFSELGEALQRPMRTYSAGMRLRISFAVATTQSADILLMDEIVGVGDANFREKSKIRIEQMIEKTGILLIASHSKAYLRNYCNRGIVMEKGKIVFDGPIEDAIEYHSGN